MLCFNRNKKERVQYQKRNCKHGKKPCFPYRGKYEFDNFQGPKDTKKIVMSNHLLSVRAKSRTSSKRMIYKNFSNHSK